jgi:hypothetical protein
MIARAERIHAIFFDAVGAKDRTAPEIEEGRAA